MKLKIRSINESNIQKTLNEADVDRGYRIKAIEKLSNQVGSDITKNGYKYKSVSQSGFYIMPEYGYLSKLVLSGTDDEEPNFNVQLQDVKNNPLKVGGKEITKLSYEEMLELADDIGLAMAKTLVSPASFDAVSENLTEDALLEYGPLSAVKGFFKQTLPDFFAKKAADKAEKKHAKAILEAINETLSESLNDAIKTLLKDGKQYVTVESKIDGNTLTLTLKCDFVTALTFNADPRDARKIVVSKLLTPLGEVKVKGKSIPDVLNMVGKVLGIKFSAFDATEVAPEISDAEDDEEVAVGDDWEALIGSDAFAHLSGVSEDLIDDITEAYKLGIPADNYMEAFNAATSAKAKEAVVRYFLFKESAGKLSEDAAKKLDTKIVGDIVDIVKSSKSFNPNAVFELLYILKFIQKYKKVEQIAVDFAKNLPDVCKNSGTLENVKSIIYSETLFNSANDIATLQKLVKHWYTTDAFKKYNLTKLSEKSKQNLVDKFDLAADFVTKTEALDLKKEILLDRAKKSFRSLAVIEALAQAIRNAIKGGKPAVRVDDEVEVSDSSTEFDIEALDPDTISEEDFKKLLRLATSKGSSAADRVKVAKALKAGLLAEE